MGAHVLCASITQHVDHVNVAAPLLDAPDHGLLVRIALAEHVPLGPRPPPIAPPPAPPVPARAPIRARSARRSLRQGDRGCVPAARQLACRCLSFCTLRYAPTIFATTSRYHPPPPIEYCNRPPRLLRRIAFGLPSVPPSISLAFLTIRSPLPDPTAVWNARRNNCTRALLNGCSICTWQI